jgi:hypothetical protein
MRCILRAGLPLAALLAATVFVSAQAEEKKVEPKKVDEKKIDKGAGDFQKLFNGKNFDGLKFVLAKKDAEPEKTWSIKDGVIICTGQPNGYFHTEKSYKDYVLRYDWLFVRPKDLTDDSKFLGNSGCLVHIQEPHKVWPKCVEVQGMNRDHGKLLFLGTKGEGTFDRKAKDKATKPVGEWNTTEITCKADGSITAKINGVEVSSGKSDLTQGVIGFQSEGAEIHFRNIVLRPMGITPGKTIE